MLPTIDREELCLKYQFIFSKKSQEEEVAIKHLILVVYLLFARGSRLGLATVAYDLSHEDE